MKFGMRKFNIKSSLRARTTGRMKRMMKRAINPLYGKKGIGWFKNPKKALYNKIYNKTTFGIADVVNFAKNSGNESNRNIKVKKEAEFMSKQWLKIAQESAQIVNSTKNPDVFFERFKLLIEKMENLSNIENLIKFKSKKPSQNLKEILDKKELTIKEFIDRFYDETNIKIKNLTMVKSKENNINKFKEKLEFYNEEMSNSNIKYYINLYEELKNKYID